MRKKSEVGKNQTLSRTERLQLTCALFLPEALLILALELLKGQLRISEAQLQFTGVIFGLAKFFLFSTWVVRWTVRLEFPGFHLQVIRDNKGQATRTMSYRESLSVAWLSSWRLLTIFFLPFMTGMAVWVVFVGRDAAMRMAPNVPYTVSWPVVTAV